MNNKIQVKCRKCRKVLIEVNVDQITDAHGNIFEFNNQIADSIICDSLTTKNELFVREDSWPEWITKDVKDSQWTKGKLKCSCDARIGSFDFVSGNRCFCSQFVLPSVHLVKSKIDYKLV